MPFVIALLVLSICFIVYLVYENKNLTTTNYLVEQINVPTAFEGMRFVCLTDLHQNCFGRKNEKLIKQIRSCNPDTILIAGDMVTNSDTKNAGIALSLLRVLAMEYEVYYAPGNHELKWAMASKYKHTGYEEYVEELKKLGVYYLDNAEIVLKKGKDLLQIVGLNLSLAYYNKGGKPKKLLQEDLKQYIPSADQNSYTILLAHVPDYFEDYVEWGADLILSGHNHGGIMRLWKLGGVISPRYQLFPKYDAGVFQKHHSVMLLSRGLGTHTIPVRIFNRPELICLQIKRKNK
jgi:predicted MPP superfamily phosphohydrolase